MASHDDHHLGSILPRILIVSRRTLRKNKLVNFVGEYHLDLIVRHGAIPVIVPRVSGIQSALKSFEPIHGVLLCEGEDVDPSLYKTNNDSSSELSKEEMEEIKMAHSSDTTIDTEKDSIELTLAKLCVAEGIPFFGICRGSQVLNVACGGTLYQDIGKELNYSTVSHIDYSNYDAHRHLVHIKPETPLHTWFNNQNQIIVNSYHHQGVKKLANRFTPMAHSPDGLIEGFYEPGHYDPNQGKFRVGLQFHPERMREFAVEGQEFDYPGCVYVYKEFVKAVIAFKTNSDDANNYTTTATIPMTLNLNVEIAEDKRQLILHSFSLGKHGQDLSNSTNDKEQGRLITSRATSNSSARARMLMERLSLDQLTDLMGFYYSMEKLCEEVIEKKRTTYNIGIIVNLD